MQHFPALLDLDSNQSYFLAYGRVNGKGFVNDTAKRKYAYDTINPPQDKINYFMYTCYYENNGQFYRTYFDTFAKVPYLDDIYIEYETVTIDISKWKRKIKFNYSIINSFKNYPILGKVLVGDIKEHYEYSKDIFIQINKKGSFKVIPYRDTHRVIHP